jgi:hypothetical protein
LQRLIFMAAVGNEFTDGDGNVRNPRGDSRAIYGLGLYGGDGKTHNEHKHGNGAGNNTLTFQGMIPL